MSDDPQLLAAFVRTGEPEAFRGLVDRHIELVYAAARRQTHDSHEAEDITQAVFIVLAQKARCVPSASLLSAWLLKITHFAAADARRSAARRQKHEQEAAAMMPTTAAPSDPEWDKLSPFLDAALARLSAADRAAIIAHCIHEQSIAQLAADLKLSEPAVRKRVQRALERLRTLLEPNTPGTPPSVVALPVLLSAHALTPAPSALASTVTTTALAALNGTAVTGTAFVLAKGVMHMMFLAKAKLALVAVLVLAILTTITGTTVHFAFAQEPAPTAIAHSSSPASSQSTTRSSRVAESLTDIICTSLHDQRLPFLPDTALTNVRRDLGKFLVEQTPADPPISTVDAVAAALPRYIAKSFPNDSRDEETYLSFPDRLATLQWRLAVALNRPPVSPADSARRDAQRQWMRDFIRSRPEPEIALKARMMKPGDLRAEALALLEAAFADPLHYLYDTMPDAAFKKMQQDITKAWDTQDEPGAAFGNFQNAAFNGCLNPRGDPKAHYGVALAVEECPFADQIVGAESYGWISTIHLRANALLRGHGQLMLDLQKGQSRNFADLATYSLRNLPLDRVQTPLSGAARDKWLADQAKGDLVLSPSGDAIIGVRGAKIATLSVKNWLDADQLSDTDLAKALQERGAESVSLADVPAWPDSGPPPLRYFYVVQTAEKRLSVIRIVEFFRGSSPTCNLYARTRPAPTNSNH